MPRPAARALQNAQRARHGEPPIRPLVLTSKDRAGEAAFGRLGSACVRVWLCVLWWRACKREIWWRCQRCLGTAAAQEQVCLPCLPLCLDACPGCAVPAPALSIPAADVLLSLAAAHVTGMGPHVAGIVLTDAERGVG